MTKTLCLLACFGFFTLASCKKKQVEPAFQNSFSCKVNGVDWKPEGGTNATGGINSKTIDVYRLSFSNLISIDALKNVRDSKTGNSIIFEGVILRVFLEVDKIQPVIRTTFYQYHDGGCNNYSSDSIPSNMVKVISLDSIQKIVKGIFEFEAKGPLCGKTLKFTEGKFEVKY